MTINGTTSNAGFDGIAGKFAETFGISAEQSERAVDALTDELQARIQRAMLSRGGVADVLSLVTNPSAGTLSDSTDLSSPDIVAAGNNILQVLIGTKHVSRGIAERVARQAGIDPATAERMLPAAAGVLIGELQRRTGPAIAKVATSVPGFAGAGGSPLPLHGAIPSRTGRPPDDWVEPTQPRPSNGKAGPIDAGKPLPIPGDNIPGLGRSRRLPEPEPQEEPEEDNPYERLPDIVRRGGQKVPGDGSLEDIIRSIFGRLLGGDRGVIGTMIELFLIRWLASLARRVLTSVLGR